MIHFRGSLFRGKLFAGNHFSPDLIVVSPGTGGGMYYPPIRMRMDIDGEMDILKKLYQNNEFHRNEEEEILLILMSFVLNNKV